MGTTGGRSHGNNNHYISVEKLTYEAKHRVDELKLNESELFSMRLQGLVRLWGMIDPKDGCFFILWYDPNHKVYSLK